MTENQSQQAGNNGNFSAFGIEEKKGLSWWIILIACFIFPVGYVCAIFAAYHKLATEKYSMLRNGKWAAGMGLGIIIFGFIFIYIGVLDPETATETGKGLFTVLFAAIFCLPGGLLMLRGINCKKTGENLLLYYPLITQSSTSECSLDDMAAKCNQSYNTVCRQIEQLIKAGLLKDSYIDQQTHCLVSPIAGSREQYVKNQANIHNQKEEGKNDMEKTIIAVKCPNCGGMNNVCEGEPQPCEYCGAVLTYGSGQPKSELSGQSGNGNQFSKTIKYTKTEEFTQSNESGQTTQTTKTTQSGDLEQADQLMDEFGKLMDDVHNIMGKFSK